jgi:hypothetical protein
MSIEGYIKCSICHEWLSPDKIDMDWLDCSDNVCHGCGTGNLSDEQDRIEAIAGRFMDRIKNLNATIQDLRNTLAAKDLYIDRQAECIKKLEAALFESSKLVVEQLAIINQLRGVA